jgi:SAM-dependent methyltransferase
MVLDNLTLDKNNSYWNCFYKSDISKSLGMNSNFAEFTLRNANEIFVNEVHKNTTLLDIGCGNGKDLNYFRQNGIDAYGVDLNAGDNSQYITRDNALNISRKCDVYYLRFFVHTLRETQLDAFLANLFKITSKESYIFLETRSSKAVTDTERSETNFQSTIGDPHYRMLYSHNYLSKKVKKYFNVFFLIEDKGFATFRGEDPYIIRMVLTKYEQGNFKKN